MWEALTQRYVCITITSLANNRCMPGLLGMYVAGFTIILVSLIVICFVF